MRLLVTFGLWVAMAAAQPSVMAPWWEGPLVRDLNLSEEQQHKIHNTVAGSRSRIILLRANLEAAEADLSELMGEETVEPAKGKAAVEKVLTARTDLARQVAQMSLALRQILTQKQWHELERRQRERLGPNPPHPGPGPGQGRPMPDGMGPDRPGVPQGNLPPPPQRKQD